MTRGTYISAHAFDLGAQAKQANVFNVPQATKAWLNITVKSSTGHETRVRYVPPSCTAYSCAIEESTTNHTFQQYMLQPEAGVWTLLFFSSGEVQTGEFSLEVSIPIPPSR